MPSKTTRSRVTNGKTLFLERVDGRSLTARRYRDLYQAFIADLGGMATVSEAQTQLARRCAAMACIAEQMEAEFVAGDGYDLERYLHLVGTLARTLTKLGLERRACDVTEPNLHEYLLQKHSTEATN